MTPIAHVSLWMIGLYARHVSPRKGFRCARRALRGGDSCSMFARRAIERAGAVAGAILLTRRFDRCAASLGELEKLTKEKRQEEGKQPDGRACDGPLGCCAAVEASAGIASACR